MKILSKIISILLLFTLVNNESKAQSNNREIGLRFTALNSAKIVYKIGITENKYRRFTFGAFNGALYPLSSNIMNSSFVGSMSFGIEKRISIAEKLKFIHGFEPNVILGYNINNGKFSPQGGLSLGYIIGFQYDFSDSFYMNLEVVPSIGAIAYKSYYNNNYSFNANVSSSPFAVSAVYKFKKKDKEAKEKI